MGDEIPTLSTVSTGVDTTTSTTQLQLGRYRRALRSRWWVVAVVTAVAVVAALVVSRTTEKTYDATAKVIVNSEPLDAVSGRTAARSLDPERDLNTDVSLVKTYGVGRAVRDQLSLQMSVPEILGEVRVGLQGVSNVLEITARDSRPSRAAAIANAFAKQYSVFRQRSARARYLAAARQAQTQLNLLKPRQRASAKGLALKARLRELQLASSLQTGGVQVVDRAAWPAWPATPRTRLDVAAGAVLGIFVGSLLAVALGLADRRLTETRDVEELLGLPVLGRIPSVKHGDESSASLLREAYADAAVNIRRRSSRAHPITVLVTSGRSDEGKTTVTLGLARAFALAGLETIAIEADLRRPGFARYAKPLPGHGLGTMLTGKNGSIMDELVAFDAVANPPAIGRRGDQPYFSILAAGSVAENPSALLSGGRMDEVLREAQGRADVVLLDTPALGAVNDALAIADRVATCILVLRLRRSTKDSALRALRSLRGAGVDVAGVVVVGVKKPNPYALDTPLPRDVHLLSGVNETPQPGRSREQAARRSSV